MPIIQRNTAFKRVWGRVTDFIALGTTPTSIAFRPVIFAWLRRIAYFVLGGMSVSASTQVHW